MHCIYVQGRTGRLTSQPDIFQIFVGSRAIPPLCNTCIILILIFFHSYSRIPAQRSYTNYVKFENLSTNIGYVFSVYASNEHGLSLEHSTINVPSEQDSKFNL